MSFTLTPNGIHKINQSTNGISEPITLQISAIKSLPGNNGKPGRNKIQLSDGNFILSGMLATQLNDQVTSGEIKTNTVISTTDIMLNDVGGRKIVIVLGCTVLGQAPGKIGDPKKYNASDAAPAAPSSSSNGSHAQKFNQTPKAQGSRASVARSPDLGCTPIMQINPYANRWKIKGRITDISNMKTWSNAKGDGKLMSITILDKHGDDIKGTFFNDTAAKYHPQDDAVTQPLEKGSMYTFSGGRVKVANAKWNNCKSEYEISFNNNCEITKVQDDGAVQKVAYSRFDIAQIEHTEPGDRTVDILASVLSFEAHNTFTSKKGNEITKRELVLGDESGASIRCTLWGDQAFTPDEKFENNPIVLITRCKIGDYGGRSLSGAFSGGALEFNPSFCAELPKVQQWLQSGGADNVTKLSSSGGGTRVDSIETRALMADIDGQNKGENPDSGDFINVKAYVTFVKTEKYSYPADPEDRKKLTWDQSAGNNGLWRNEVTGKEYEQPDHTYCLSLKLEDYTGGTYATCLGNKPDQAQALVGYTANELMKMEETDEGKQRVIDILENIKGRSRKFTLLCTMDNKGEEPRKQIKVFRVDKTDYAKESGLLLAAIEKYDTM